jgi:hypothetical protein
MPIPVQKAGSGAVSVVLPVHRAVSAVLHVMLVAFVTLSARVQHGVLRSKHWFAMAALTISAYVVAGSWAWSASGMDKWSWG